MNDTTNIINVTTENFSAVVEASQQLPVMFDFWADWCSPCKSLLPIIEKLASEYQEKFILAKVNIDEQKAIADQFGVRSVPTVKLVRDSQIIGEFVGAQSESQVRNFIEKFIETANNQDMTDVQEALAAGDTANAEVLLREAISQSPSHAPAYAMLVELIIMQGRLDEAELLLDTLPEEIAMESEFKALRGRLSFSRAVTDAPTETTLRATLSTDPKNSPARYQLAARMVTEGRAEEALELLLELLRTDRAYGDDSGRKAMLKIFDLLGSDDELTTRFRRLMFSILH